MHCGFWEHVIGGGGRDGAVGGRWESDKQITLSRLFPTMLVHKILFIFTHVKV